MGLAAGGAALGRSGRGALRQGLVAAPPVAANPGGCAGLAARGLPGRPGERRRRPLLAHRAPGRALLHGAHGAASAAHDDGSAAAPAGRAVPGDPVGAAAAASAPRGRARGSPGTDPARPEDAHVDAGRGGALHRDALGMASPGGLRGRARVSGAPRHRAPDVLRDGRALLVADREPGAAPASPQQRGDVRRPHRVPDPGDRAEHAPGRRAGAVGARVLPFVRRRAPAARGTGGRWTTRHSAGA